MVVNVEKEEESEPKVEPEELLILVCQQPSELIRAPRRHYYGMPLLAWFWWSHHGGKQWYTH
jgi:hypothetical protein